MAQAIQFAILGLGAGAAYTLLAQGIVLIYRGSGIVNFAHGAIAMFAAFFCFLTLVGDHGWPVGAAIPAGLDQAPVQVAITQQRADGVLAVPVTALLATAGGGYAVQAAGPHGRLIPVTTGLFAAGYVQVSGPGIYPGLQVTDSQG